MGNNIANNDSYGLKYGNENEFKFKRLNIYIYDNKENKKKYKIIEDEFQNSKYKLRFFYNEDLNRIIRDIENKFDENLSLQNSYNIILTILKEDKNIEKEKEKFLVCLKGEYSSIRPTIILSKKIYNENEKEQVNNNNTFNKKNQKNIYPEKIEEKHISADLRNSDISNEYIELVYYKNDKNFSEIIEKIKQLYCYYNNIGDIYTIINYQLGQHVDYDENGAKYPYKPTLNILVIGRSGGGKSTLINLLLNEKKALTGSKLSGLSKTQLFSRYIHQEYPITFIDTPGIEREEDFKNMKDYLSETKKLFKDGKNKIHTILYIINSSEPRNFNQKEIELIDFIHKNMNIQIFFVCTRAEEQKKAKHRKELIKINLIQNFGKDTPLVNFIYPCQLLDEKDGIFKRFGIDELLNGIYSFYKDQKNKLERTKRNISNNQNNNDYNKNLDNQNNNNYNKNLDNQNNNNYIQTLDKRNNNNYNKNIDNQNNNNYNKNLDYQNNDYYNKNLDKLNNNNYNKNLDDRSDNTYIQNLDNQNNNNYIQNPEKRYTNNYIQNPDKRNNNNYNKNLDNQNHNNYIQNLDYQNHNNYNKNNIIYNQPSDNQIFLKDLNHYNYNNLKNYLDNFCEDIINYYETYIKEIEIKRKDNSISTVDGNEPSMDNLRKMAANMLIKHLAYELNGDLLNKEIKDLIYSFKTPRYNRQFHLSMSEEIKQVGIEAKNIFLKSLEQNFDSQSQNYSSRAQNSEQIYFNYFNNLIDNYINAIESFNNLYKKK